MKKGKNYLIPRSAASRKKHTVGVTVDYAPNPNPPAAAVGVGHGRRQVLVSASASSERSNGPASAGPLSFHRLARVLLFAPRDRRPRRPADPRDAVRAPPPRPCWSCRSSRSRSAGRSPKLAALRGAALFALPARVEVVLGALGVFVFFLTVYAGLFGTDAQSENLAPTAVYVGFWVGVPFVSLLLRRRLRAC